MNERQEALFRIIVLIISGIIIWAWAYVAIILMVVHWLVALFSNKRNKDIAEFIEYWNTESYKFFRYISGVTNQRPFPFSGISIMSKFQK